MQLPDILLPVITDIFHLFKCAELEIPTKSAQFLLRLRVLSLLGLILRNNLSVQ